MIAIVLLCVFFFLLAGIYRNTKRPRVAPQKLKMAPYWEHAHQDYLRRQAINVAAENAIAIAEAEEQTNNMLRERQLRAVLRQVEIYED